MKENVVSVQLEVQEEPLETTPPLPSPDPAEEVMVKDPTPSTQTISPGRRAITAITSIPSTCDPPCRRVCVCAVC